MKNLFHLILLTILSALNFYLSNTLSAQTLYLGADLSYVNEMEDCGVEYKEDGVVKDVYEMFADHKCNLVRLRLWHSPKWYDNLNDGQRYSDFDDVRKSIGRAKAAGMEVLLNFHLSDNWADPSKQRVPDAWLDVVDELPVLKDSLYNYISSTLTKLYNEGLLPEMVQIGNETNKGILLSPEDDATWTLNWNRNAQLFNEGIRAVRDVQATTGEEIKIALHLAAPAETNWLLNGFLANGVVDFDIIGISYYWAWHKPTTIAQTGNIISNLRQTHPGKEVMIFETGYIWTFESNDSANNIINDTHPDYHPPSPENQRKWLEDLTKEVVKSGGNGVIYWEPAWVSSPCRTQWGRGSHQEHATFFDFNNNLLEEGGMFWYDQDYLPTSTNEESIGALISFLHHPQYVDIELNPQMVSADTVQYAIYNALGQQVRIGHLHQLDRVDNSYRLNTQALQSGGYILVVTGPRDLSGSFRFVKQG